MKTILIILGIMILLSKKKDIKNLFKSQQTIKKEIVKAQEELKDKNKLSKPDADSVMAIVGVIFVLFHVLFYLLAAIEINLFPFTVISVLLIFGSFRSYFKMLNNLKDMENYIPSGFLKRLLNFVIGVFYVGFVFYSIYLSW